MPILYKFSIVIGALVFWFVTQRWLGKRKPLAEREIRDYILEKTSKYNDYLHGNPKTANILLVSSSFFIDVMGIFIIYWSIMGPDIKPLISLIIVFFLRQVNQAVTELPAPKGIIWRDPKVPSLFVTYGVSNDLFFSGHTALAALGALELMKLQIPVLSFLAVLIFLYEVIVVLILRAHWTMDVFTGAVTALCTFLLVNNWNF